MATTKTSTTKKAAARKPAQPKLAAQPAVKGFEVPDMDEINDRFEELMIDAVKFMRGATHASIGAGLVVRDRFDRREFSTISYSTFIDQAKAKGETRMEEIQDRFEPYVQRVSDRFEPVAERVESRLPEQVKDVIESGRQRVRNVLDA